MTTGIILRDVYPYIKICDKILPQQVRLVDLPANSPERLKSHLYQIGDVFGVCRNGDFYIVNFPSPSNSNNLYLICPDECEVIR